MSKELTLTETHLAVQSLYKCTVKELTDLLRSSYSSEWSEKNYEAARKQAERDLKVLIQMNLVQKDESQKAHRYMVKRNHAFTSKASKHIEDIENILNDESTLLQKIREPLSMLLYELESPYFIKKNVENISDKTEILAKLESAINHCLYIDLIYHKDGKSKEFQRLRPLKIAEFEGFFYLLCEDREYFKLRLSKIGECHIHNEKYEKNELDELRLNQWHNVWHNPNQKPNRIKLWISREITQYFYDKNIFDINKNTNRIKKCDDGIEYYVEITHPFELLPQLMYWLPNITILEDFGELNVLGAYKSILQDAVHDAESIFNLSIED